MKNENNHRCGVCNVGFITMWRHAHLSSEQHRSNQAALNANRDSDCLRYDERVAEAKAHAMASQNSSDSQVQA